MADDEIIRRRLLIDGDGTGEARVMTKFIKSFIKWSTTEDGPGETQIQYDRLLAQLANIECTSEKWSNVFEMNGEEVKYYEDEKENTNIGVSDAHTAINDTKVELEDGRKIRKNRMEYDALAKLIKEHPPRSDTANKLTLINQELNSLKNKKDLLEQKVNVRRKQFHVLVTALHNLQETLMEEPIESIDDDGASFIDLTTDSQMEVA